MTMHPTEGQRPLVLSVNVEILLIALLIIVNGLLAMSEIAVVSARKVRLQHRAGQGDAKAQAALQLANEPNRFLSTVQVGITLVGIFAGAFGGATLAEQIAASLAGVPVLAPYAEAIGLAVVVVAITFLSLVFGELVPKRVAMHNPEHIAVAIAQPMTLLSKVMAPVVALLSVSTERVLRLFGITGVARGEVSEEDIRILIRKGTQTGLFEEAEQEMVERVLHLGDRKISSLMTHRSQVEAIDLDDPWQENLAKIREAPHAFFPVCRDGLDQVLGMVYVKDLLLPCLDGQPPDINQALRQPVFVPESMPALKVLESFQQSGNHIALVTDEYGVIQGLVTLTNVMEGIVGDIPTEAELSDLRIVRRADGSWLVDGLLPVDEFKELLEIDALPDEERGGFETVSGFVIAQLGRIPTPADTFDWQDWRFEVMDMDGNRVDKVLVTSQTDEQRGLVP